MRENSQDRPLAKRLRQLKEPQSPIKFDSVGQAMKRIKELRDRENFEKAIALGEEWLNHNSPTTGMLNIVAGLYLSIGQPAQAEEKLRLAMKMNPNDGYLIARLAIAVAEQERVVEALSLIEGMLAHDPKNPVAISLRDRFKKQLGQQKKL